MVTTIHGRREEHRSITCVLAKQVQEAHRNIPSTAQSRAMMRAGKAQGGSASSDRKWTSGPTADTRLHLLLTTDVESRLASVQF